jgi:hypothetical protein
MLPEDVLKRKDLSAYSKVVLGGIGLASHGSGRISMSHGAIGKICGVSRTQVLACYRELSAAGLLEAHGEPVKQIQSYRILHPRLIGKKVAELTKPIAKPKPGLVSCPKCGKQCKRLKNVGYCRKCGWKEEIRALAREEIAKTA